MRITLNINSIQNEELKKAYEAYEIAYRELYTALMRCNLSSIELVATENKKDEEI